MNYELINPNNNEKSIIGKILINRGIAPNDIYHYLHTSDDDILDPALIAFIHDGARMLMQHIHNEDDVLIQIDSDCDGYTSAALLINYLNSLFPGFTQNHISYQLHNEKTHGITTDTISDNIKLIIVPDASSNEYDIHKELAQKGIDILIIDHHEADKISPYACVINNQLCDYPTKTLSGVGMVYKFCSYIDRLIGNINNADNFLDLVALGMIADMMSMRDFETKRLTEKGLKNISNPFFKAMVEKQSYSLGNNITPDGVAWYIAPYINAINRSGTPEERLIVFEAMLDYRAYEQIESTKRGALIGQTETRVEQAVRTCVNVKNRQTKSQDNCEEIVDNIIEENDLLKNKLLIITLDSAHAIDKNLTGLLANKLANKYQRPTLILNSTTHAIFNADTGELLNYENWWEGSGRGYEKSAMKDFRKFLTSFPETVYAEGHANAFGYGIKKDDLDTFITKTNEALQEITFTPKYDVDIIFNSRDINKNAIFEIGSYKGLWAQDIDEPLVALENLEITGDHVILLKGTTLKLIAVTLSGERIELIKFKAKEDEFNNLYTLNGSVVLNVVGTCDINRWQGLETPQILIKDYEIVKTNKYCF